MKKSILLLICFLSTALPSISQQEQKSKDWWVPKEIERTPEEIKFDIKYPTRVFDSSVSLVQLIVNPEKFDGKRIWVEGCICDMYECHALYLSKDDLKHRINSNRITTSFSKELRVRSHSGFKSLGELNTYFVGLEGVFHAKTSYDSRGELSDIVKVTEL